MRSFLFPHQNCGCSFLNELEHINSPLREETLQSNLKTHSISSSLQGVLELAAHILYAQTHISAHIRIDTTID